MESYLYESDWFEQSMWAVMEILGLEEVDGEFRTVETVIGEQPDGERYESVSTVLGREDELLAEEAI